MKINPLTAADGYKISHRKQYPDGTTLVYSNLTPRSDRLSPIPAGLATGEVTFFGLQYFIEDFLQDSWNDGFFKRPKAEVVEAYRRRIEAYLGPDAADVEHIEALHDLGYLPICIKALPEGTNVPMKVPVLTIHNTHPDFAWLTNYLETALSASLWKSTTSATIARHYRLLLDRYALLTGADPDFVWFQGHDFSMRGMSGMHDAALTGAGHLTSFVGTDSIPAIDLVERYYDAGAHREVVACSVPATEHSVATSNILKIASEIDAGWSTEQKLAEAETVFIERLIGEIHPTGVVSIVADSFDFWRVVSEILPGMKDLIMGRDGKVVCRPDSGNPVDIICGKPIECLDDADDIATAKCYAAEVLCDRISESAEHGRCGPDSVDGLFRFQDKCYKATLEVFWNRHDKQYYYIDERRLSKFEEVTTTPEQKGAVECLWDAFGGTVNAKGYKVLDPHVGLIYGDSITLERAEAILKGLEAKGFCSSNVVFGIGSFTYQHVTRDSFGFAVKSTAAVVDDEVVEIYKDPKTDNGTKKSAKGFLSVQVEDGRLVLKDRQASLDTPGCQLREVFRDGDLLIEDDLETIRRRVAGGVACCS